MKKAVIFKQIVLVLMLIGILALVSCSFRGCGEEKHEHSYIANVINPTCTEQGYTTYTCDCGDSYVSDYVDALEHTEVVDAAVAPTCTETGLTEGSHCSVCETIIVAQKIVPAGHTYGEPEIIANADCFNDGEQKLSCVNCEHEETQVFNKLEHEFALVEGTELNECSLCGALEFNGHLYVAFMQALSFSDAEEYCESLGGHLVTVTSQEEQEVVNHIIENAQYPEGNIYYAFWFYSGAKKVDSQWTWITGEEFTYTNWGAEEPDSKDQCYMTFASMYEENYNYHHNIGTWEDVYETTLAPAWAFICEWEPEE